MPRLKTVRFLPFLIATFVAVPLLFSCTPIDFKYTPEKSGIPVKEYEATIMTKAASDAEQKRISEELEMVGRLSKVTENHVFTQRRGLSEYLVGPKDILTITFWSIAVGGASTYEGFKQISYNVEVRDDGKISYMYGDDIQVGGLTTYEIQQKLLADLRQYFRNPRIEVLIKEYKSKSAILFGQINTLPSSALPSGPGRYALNGKTTIMELISKAGGPITGRANYAVNPGMGIGYSQITVENANLSKVELLRKGKTYNVNLYKAMFHGDESQNPIVDDGDVITVPPEPFFADRIYVFGQVNTVGILRLRDAPDLLAALALSGGTTSAAIRKDIKIIRSYRERGREAIILSANYDEILYRGDLAQNVRLQSGDVIYVPRRAIGDVNEFITNTTPLLNYLLLPGSYRNTYSLDQNRLRW